MSAGVVTLPLLVVSVLTGDKWWTVVFTAIATLVFAIRWYQERRRFGGDDEPPSRMG